jgi:hypothetical protein
MNRVSSGTSADMLLVRGGLCRFRGPCAPYRSVSTWPCFTSLSGAPMPSPSALQHLASWRLRGGAVCAASAAVAQHLGVSSTIAWHGGSGRFVDPVPASATGSGTSGQRALSHAALLCPRSISLGGAPMPMPSPSAPQRWASGGSVVQRALRPPPLHTI